MHLIHKPVVPDFFTRLTRLTLIVQAVYTLLTALWALVDIRSFMMITGPKTDVWLVKTVAVLLIPIAVTCLLFLRLPGDKRILVILAGSSAFGLACIDIWYVFQKKISAIYLADAFLEGIFVVIWIYLGAQYYFTGRAQQLRVKFPQPE